MNPPSLRSTTASQLSDMGSVQIDDEILRISTILRKARNIKNCLALINRFPSETLAHIVTFLPTERDLVNATAVCQYWRTTLLSFPRLWSNPGGSSSEIQAYIDRSRSIPICVTLSSPDLAELIAPHTSRLIRLTVQLEDINSLRWVAEHHLHYPIPTLHVFRIIADPLRLRTLAFPSDIQNPFFLHSRRLEIEGVSAFRGYQTFPHVTELTLETNPYLSMPMDSFLSVLEQLLVLERVSIKFRTDLYTDPIPHMVTLPHAQEMSLSASSRAGMPVRIPHILEFLRLPSLTSLRLRAMPKLVTFRPIFPVMTFDEHLPNFVELPELQVRLGTSSGEVTFQSASQATLEYLTGQLSSFDRHERILWRELPLHSVRKLTANMAFAPSDQELEWLIGLLRHLKSLKELELCGKSNAVLGWLRHYMAREATSFHIQTLTVRYGGEGYLRRRAFMWKGLFEADGVNVTVICIPEPGVHEEESEEERGTKIDGDGSSDEWEEGDGVG